MLKTLNGSSMSRKKGIYNNLPMQQISCSLSSRFMWWWLPFAHNREPCDKPIGVSTVVLYECIQSMHCCVLFNGKKCIFSMSPDLIVDHFTLKTLMKQICNHLIILQHFLFIKHTFITSHCHCLLTNHKLYYKVAQKLNSTFQIKRKH